MSLSSFYLKLYVRVNLIIQFLKCFHGFIVETSDTNLDCLEFAPKMLYA